VQSTRTKGRHEVTGALTGCSSRSSASLDQRISSRADDRVDIAVDDPGAIADIDTPEDFRNLLERMHLDGAY
jgi:hypothetical protein